jgi:hypothetical protein
MKDNLACVIYLVLLLRYTVDGQRTLVDLPKFYQRNAWDEFTGYVPSFSYSLTASTPFKALKTTDLLTCGQVLQQGYINFEKKQFNIQQGFFYGSLQISLNPKTDSTPALVLIPKCNPYMDTNCKACAKDNAGYEATVSVYREDQGDPVAKIQCVHFDQLDCGARTCKQGEYASGYITFDSNGFVTAKTSCVPCAPGTWLTCINDASCTYNIPAAAGAFETAGQIYRPDDQEPVGACYTCKSAGNRKVHYGQTNRIVKVEPEPREPLPWYCPGGDAPPVLCLDPFIGATADLTACACKPGYFQNAAGAACQICPKGSKCPEGKRTECPDDTYQDKEGSTSCTSCLSEGGDTNACETTLRGASAKKMRKCIGVYKSEPPLCVLCNMCKRPYDDISPGVIECY